MRNFGVAEDVLGDVFLDVVRHLPTFAGGAAEFQTWLFRIAHNRFIDEHRRNSRRAHGTPEVHESKTVERDVSEIAQERSAEQRVYALLSALPDDQRSVMYMRTMIGMSFSEIAEAMVRSVGAAKMLHKRGLQTIGERLTANQKLPGDD